MKLIEKNLQYFKNVSIPIYDRSQLKPGIVHIGLGNFHRAHQAWYLHRLFQQGLNHDWAIIGAGVRPYDEKARLKMQAQDYLTSLIELHPSKDKVVEIVGSMIDYVPIEEGNAALIKQLADPAIRIVSLTVTEGGYFIDPATQSFDATNKEILYDVENFDQPKTAFGAIIAALKIRRDQNHGPFTLQSCDNLQGNGNILRQTILSLAKLSDFELATWIEENCTFPNSMVDCIVPATGAKELALIRELGIEDNVPVTHEDFRQWVIEDNFCAGRPDWEKVGARLTNDVHSYETMKIRILNGGHQIIAATGDLLSIDTISDTMKNPLIAGLFNKIEHEEIMPNVKAVAEFTPTQYVELINQRFSNTAIVDTTKRVAFDGSSRQPGFLLPSVFDTLKAGGSVFGLALASAIWAHYCQGVREDGSIIEANDPMWDDLKARANKAKENPQSWIENTVIYGDLGKTPEFAEPFVKCLESINKKGLVSTISQYLEY